MTVKPSPREVKYIFEADDMAELLIGRDFSYSDPRGLVLLAMFRGSRIRFQFEDRDRAFRTYKKMRRLGAEYLDTDDDGKPHRWAGAPFKLLALARHEPIHTRSSEEEQ